MKSLVFISLIIFFSVLPEYSQTTFWRRPALPSDPNAQVYKELQKIPSPRVTAQKILRNFMGFGFPSVHSAIAKRSFHKEDIVIVMDGSGSVGACEFNEGRKAFIQEIEMCEVKRNGMKPSCRQAAVTFSSGAKRNFNFLPPAQATQKLSSISYPGGGTNTQAGLAEAYKLFTESGTGRRSSARRKVLLLTDGQSNIDKAKTVPNAQKLKNIGVQVSVIAVGHRIPLEGIQEMAKVASYPANDNVYRVSTNGDFVYVFKIISSILRKTFLPKSSTSPC